MDCGFAVLDTETTGLDCYSDRIVEIAIIRLNPDGLPIDEFRTLVNPERAIPVSATRIHGIRDKHVRTAPTFSQIAQEITRRVTDSVIVAHNATFDLGFLREEFARVGVSFDAPPFLCSMRLAERMGVHRKSLADCCSHFGVRLEDAHSALGDARAVVQLMGVFLAEARAAGISTAEGLTDLRRASGAWPSAEPTRELEASAPPLGEDGTLPVGIPVIEGHCEDPGAVEAASAMPLDPDAQWDALPAEIRDAIKPVKRMAGKTVHFTGGPWGRIAGQSLTKELAARLVERAGLVIHEALRTDTTLVVAPHARFSATEEAREAVASGIELMGEKRFWRTLHIPVVVETESARREAERNLRLIRNSYKVAKGYLEPAKREEFRHTVEKMERYVHASAPPLPILPANVEPGWKRTEGWRDWDPPLKVVAGTTHHAKALRTLVGPEQHEDYAMPVDVQLNFDGNGIADGRAIQVVIEGREVGHIVEELGAPWSEAMLRSNVRAISVAGILRGGSYLRPAIGCQLWLDRRLTPGLQFPMGRKNYRTSTWPPAPVFASSRDETGQQATVTDVPALSAPAMQYPAPTPPRQPLANGTSPAVDRESGGLLRRVLGWFMRR